jgi:hypothetical protein
MHYLKPSVSKSIQNKTYVTSMIYIQSMNCISRYDACHVFGPENSLDQRSN